MHTHKNMSSIKSACYTNGNLGAKKLVRLVEKSYMECQNVSKCLKRLLSVMHVLSIKC